MNIFGLSKLLRKEPYSTLLCYGYGLHVAFAPPYKRVRLAPVPDKRLGFAKCSIETVSGQIESNWYYKADRIAFEFIVPDCVTAEIVLPDGHTKLVTGGSYTYAVRI